MLYLRTPGICKTTETSSIRHLFGLGGWVGGSPPILSLFGFSEMSDNWRPPLKKMFIVGKENVRQDDALKHPQEYLASSQALPTLKVAMDDECSGKGLVFSKNN